MLRIMRKLRRYLPYLPYMQNSYYFINLNKNDRNIYESHKEFIFFINSIMVVIIKKIKL